MNDPYFETTDACLAATLLITARVPLVRAEHREDGQTNYVLVYDHVLDDIEDLYERGGIRVDPMMFCAALRCLRLQSQTDPLQ